MMAILARILLPHSDHGKDHANQCLAQPSRINCLALESPAYDVFLCNLCGQSSEATLADHVLDKMSRYSIASGERLCCPRGALAHILCVRERLCMKIGAGATPLERHQPWLPHVAVFPSRTV